MYLPLVDFAVLFSLLFLSSIAIIFYMYLVGQDIKMRNHFLIVASTSNLYLTVGEENSVVRARKKWHKIKKVERAKTKSCKRASCKSSTEGRRIGGSKKTKNGKRSKKTSTNSKKFGEEEKIGKLTVAVKKPGEKKE